jgi:peptidoglycan/LPS O-acetylase OafA/YrhL
VFTRSATRILIAGGLVGLVGLSLAAGAVDMGPLVENWLGGFARVVFSFFIGVMLCGCRHYLPTTSIWIYPSVLLVVFMTPVTSGSLNAVFDLVAVVVVFPLLVGSASNCDAGRTARLCNVSGELSYPLYAIHYPVIRAICFILMRHPSPVGARVGVGVGVIVFVCFLSWASLHFYDRPLRRLLTRHFVSARELQPPPDRSFASARSGEMPAALPQTLD